MYMFYFSFLNKTVTNNPKSIVHTSLFMDSTCMLPYELRTIVQSYVHTYVHITGSK